MKDSIGKQGAKEVKKRLSIKKKEMYMDNKYIKKALIIPEVNTDLFILKHRDHFRSIRLVIPKKLVIQSWIMIKNCYSRVIQEGQNVVQPL